MTTFNTVATWASVALGVSAVACLAIAALMGAARHVHGGPRPGSLERDDDEEQR